ncbi:MAG TPA: hypothetical protein VJX16_17300 [Terriglobales bacterium]|nr:hypothetical protein [Terriglobales bacterium]
MRLLRRFILVLTILLSSFLLAQEAPYFVTYDHHLEEPRNLEIATSSTIGVPRAGQKAYFAPYLELEYGAKAWWTTEFYLEGQSTRGDSAVFTGWRLENRFRPLMREHWINPVLYVEYENVNEATRIQKEIVGNTPDFGAPNAELVRERSHELEAKLILSSNTHSWNVSENFIVEKNLSASEGFEFGYALGVSRPLSTMASDRQCRFCRENFTAGLELYGGLGSTEGFGLHNTTHYLGPVISWQVSDNAWLHFSPAVGLTRESNPVLLRFGYSYEVRGFGRRLARFLRGRP